MAGFAEETRDRAEYDREHRQAQLVDERPAIGLVVIALRGDRIRSLIRFENRVLPWFGLPQSLPSS